MKKQIQFDILTLFPDMFKDVLGSSIIGRAQSLGIVKIKVHDLRHWGLGRHKQVDDSPYGGGPGMVMRVDVIDKALSKIKKKTTKVILLTPQGKSFDQKKAKSLSKNLHIILICGHYEGYDERIRELVDEEISIGDYILTGGEIPAMVIVDSVSRLVPGVLGKSESLTDESFSNKNLLEYPQYTRPEDYKGKKVPKMLLSGHHKNIKEWRKNEAEKRTKKRRPDLL